jgi:hypothetical protein
MKKTIITTLLDREKVDPSTSVDTITNDHTEDIVPEYDELTGAQIVDVEAKPEIPDITVITVNQVTPMTIMTQKSPDGKDVAALVLLCKDTENNTFTLVNNYIIENDQQKKQVERNPIHDNVNYISKRLASNMIMSALPCYITDMNFYYNKEAEIPSEQFYMFAVPNDANDKRIIKFNLSSDLFSVIAFIDDYITSDSHNIHDLQIATVAGYKQSDMVIPVCFVDNIDSIISLAPSTEKDSTDVIVVFKTLEFVSSTEKNVYKILTAFDFGKKYNRKKYRGCTLKSIEEGYGKDIDQYLSNYMIECRLKNIDKDYLVIKAKNKDGRCKLFFIDNDNQKKIEELVEMY